VSLFKYIKWNAFIPTKKVLHQSVIYPKEIEFTMENIYLNIKLLKLITKWRVHLIILVALAIVLSILFSSPWFIKPMYKSSTVLYPSNLIPYSSETPTELMLQIFRSDDIQDSLIEKFDLASHYDIDKNDEYYHTRVIKEFESNVDIRKTEYESVVIEILDADPKIACNMVKEMVNLFNKKARKMQREKSDEVLKIATDQLNNKQLQIDTLQKKLNDIWVNYGILDSKVQTKELTKQYYKMFGNTRKINANSVNSTMENLKTKGGDFILLNDMFDAATSAYAKLKEEYENALRDATKELTYTNYISSPVPADKKTYPIRWLIVVITGLATFTLALLIIILIENFRKKEKISNNTSA
jgi:hypothetical protein